MSFSESCRELTVTADRDELRSITELLDRFNADAATPSRETVLRAVRAGRVEGAVLIGKTYYVTPIDFERWLESRIRPVGSPRSALPESVRAWAERVAASAPELSPEQAAQAARLIVAGGASA